MQLPEPSSATVDSGNQKAGAQGLPKEPGKTELVLGRPEQPSTGQQQAKRHRRMPSLLTNLSWLKKPVLAVGGLGALLLSGRVSARRVRRARELGDQRSWWRVLTSRIQRSEKQTA